MVWGNKLTAYRCQIIQNRSLLCLWLMEWYTWEMPECPWSSCVMVSEPSSWMMLFFKPQEIDVQCVIHQCLRFVWRVSTSTRSHEWLSSKAPNTSLFPNWSKQFKTICKIYKSPNFCHEKRVWSASTNELRAPAQCRGFDRRAMVPWRETRGKCFLEIKVENLHMKNEKDSTAPPWGLQHCLNSLILFSTMSTSCQDDMRNWGTCKFLDFSTSGFRALCWRFCQGRTLPFSLPSGFFLFPLRSFSRSQSTKLCSIRNLRKIPQKHVVAWWGVVQATWKCIWQDEKESVNDIKVEFRFFQMQARCWHDIHASVWGTSGASSFGGKTSKRCSDVENSTGLGTKSRTSSLLLSFIWRKKIHNRKVLLQMYSPSFSISYFKSNIGIRFIYLKHPFPHIFAWKPLCLRFCKLAWRRIHTINAEGQCGLEPQNG